MYIRCGLKFFSLIAQNLHQSANCYIAMGDFTRIGLKTQVSMDYLPSDPAILVSSINMLLRDEEYDSLEQLCYAFSRDPQEVKEYLHKYGYVYSESQKQMRPEGYDGQRA